MRKRGRRGNGSVASRTLRNGRVRYQAQYSVTEGGRRVRKAATFDLKRDAE